MLKTSRPIPRTHSLRRRVGLGKRMGRKTRLVSDWRVKAEKGSRRRLVQDLDEVVSKIVRVRDGFRCVLCGSTYQPQAGHIFKRGKLATRWHLSNVWTQCPGCNLRHNARPEIYMTWAIEKMGSEAFGALRGLAYSGKRFTDAELQSMLDSYRQMLKEM